MYLFTTLGKFAGQWDLGTGEIWYHITLSEWFRFSSVEWLRNPWVCLIAVHGSLLVEGAFAFLVWTGMTPATCLAADGIARVDHRPF